MTYRYTPPERLLRMEMPERAEQIGASVLELERALGTVPLATDGLDLTGADTHRFPPPEWALPTFSAAAMGGGATYTPYRGDLGVRRILAPSLERLLGVSVDPERELILTPGTQAGLFGILSALLEPGDRVLVADPDYLLNERIVRYLGAEITSIPVLFGEGVAPSLDLDALAVAMATRPRLFLFSHPNNPTGSVYDRAVIERVAELAAAHDVFVLVDQLYCRLVYDEAPFTHLVGLPGMRDRCATLVGPSKTESLSGYRVGAAVGPREVIDRVEDVLCLSAMRAPAYAQHVLGPWLARDEEWVRDRVVTYGRLRDRTVERLHEFPGIRVYRSAGTSYVFPDVRALGCTDQCLAVRLRADAGLVINPGYQFGALGVGHFRICFAQDETRLDRALDAMLAVFRAVAVSVAA